MLIENKNCESFLLEWTRLVCQTLISKSAFLLVAGCWLIETASNEDRVRWGVCPVFSRTMDLVE